MPAGLQSSSDDSSDSFQCYNHGMQKMASAVGLQWKWEEVEKNLYHESDGQLSTALANECKLWKESFPYLRVRGYRIDHPLNQKKEKLRQQVISTVVDQLIEKMSGEGLNLGRDNKVQRPTAPSKESYFERGKEKITQQDILPRSILKNSPKKVDRKQRRNSTSFQKSRLPRISAKSNNWLARSERRCSELALPANKAKIVLPPVAQKLDSK